MGCHFLLQGIFPTQGSNLGLPHCGPILYVLSHEGSLRLFVCDCFLVARPSSQVHSLCHCFFNIDSIHQAFRPAEYISLIYIPLLRQSRGWEERDKEHVFPGALGLADSAISEGQGNSEQETVGPERVVTGRAGVLPCLHPWRRKRPTGHQNTSATVNKCSKHMEVQQNRKGGKCHCKPRAGCSVSRARDPAALGGSTSETPMPRRRVRDSEAPLLFLSINLNRAARCTGPGRASSSVRSEKKLCCDLTSPERVGLERRAGQV